MKNDLATAIIAAVVGTIVSYLIVSTLFVNAPKPISIKNLDQDVSSSLDNPSNEVFNYRAINPTVEVYIDCNNYDAEGVCIDGNVTIDTNSNTTGGNE